MAPGMEEELEISRWLSWIFSEAAGDHGHLTSALVLHWAEMKQIPADRVKTALTRIEALARYQSPTTDKNYKWWVSAYR